jgi:hypothetical protein
MWRGLEHVLLGIAILAVHPANVAAVTTKIVNVG